MPATDQLWIHVRCGQLRGTTRLGEQRCPCQPSQDRWPDCDVNEVAQLCVVCVRGSGGGPTRWSWLACLNCRQINDSLGSRLGRRPLPLGRHSLMNGIGHLVADPDDASIRGFAIAVAEMSVGYDRLMRWRVHEVQRLASAAGMPEVVLLAGWRHQFPPHREASASAYSRLLAADSGVADD